MSTSSRTFLQRWCLLAGLLAFSVAPVAGAERLVFDPDLTRIGFELGATLHSVRGTARLSPSVLEFDRKEKTCSGNVSVDARSLESGNARRDRVMHDKVLESEEYPEIGFVCRRFVGEVADGRIVVSGNFAIHGQTHSLDMELDLKILADSVVVTSTFEVPYVLWGLKDPSKPLLRVKKLVRISLEATAELVDDSDRDEVEHIGR